MQAGDVLDLRVDTGATLSASATHNLTIRAQSNFNVFGVYGETDLVEASSGLIAYVITAGNWGDLSSISLPAGEWDIAAWAQYRSNGVVTTTTVDVGVGVTAGNVAPSGGFPAANTSTTKRTASGTLDYVGLPRVNMILNETTTVYLKGNVGVSITNLQVAYKISARRVK